MATIIARKRRRRGIVVRKKKKGPLKLDKSKRNGVLAKRIGVRARKRKS